MPETLTACIRPESIPTTAPVWLYADGACDTTQKHGGWACILRVGDHEKVFSGCETETTNNRMELLGLIRGLEALKRPCVVMVVTDSKYLRDAFTSNWILNWQRNGWQTSGKTAVKNQDLWQQLIGFARVHDMRFVWVKGHAGHIYNERVDKLAVQERLKLR